MKAGLSLIIILLLCGCEYEVPLSKEAVIPVTPALTGLWQAIPDEGQAEDPGDRLMILPVSATEYMAVVSPGEDSLYFRAYPIRLADMELIQLEWLGIDREKDEPYDVCRYSLKDGVLTVEMLNDDVVSPDIEDSASLRDALLADRSHPDLFEEQGRYRKLED